MSLLHPLVERVLLNRHIEDQELFLNPVYNDRHDPFLLKDMDKAVARILTAIEQGETICIWHDYDCDGIPGGSLLFDFFHQIEYPVLTYVPERSEGYGLNEDGIKNIKKQGVSLIITVDCGITDVAETACAKELGIDVIITDHHLPQATLPDALAVINAHRHDDTYPFKGLCGTGTAFKLVEALIQKGDFDLTEGWEKWLLDLVAIATVADMVPLTGENRALVRYGLMVLHKGRRPGLVALLEAEKIPQRTVTEDDIAFSIAPKINAASRMKSPKLAFELLTTDSPERAKELAKELVKLNKDRKLEGMRVAKEVKQKIELMSNLGDVIVMGHSSWRPSLLGIAATSVVETYQKTVCLWGKDGELIKGSCRSDGSVNIVTLMTEAKDAFLDFGGHEFSGGFSVLPEAIHELPSKLQNALQSINDKLNLVEGLPAPLPEEGNIEGVITLSEVTDSAYEALRSLAPFGQHNPKPIFRFTNVTVYAFTFFGAHKEHVRLTLTDLSGRQAQAVAFFVPRTPFKDTIALMSAGDVCTVDACIERSYFAGRRELRLRLENISV